VNLNLHIKNNTLIFAFKSNNNMIYTKQFPTDDFSDIDQTIKNSNANLAHLKSIDKAQNEKGENLLYRYFNRQVADGYAWYQVTKVTQKTATVKWCDGICLDDYQDMMLGDEATLSRVMVEKLVSSRIAMDKLFSR
jgi:hypothetical protein